MKQFLINVKLRQEKKRAFHHRRWTDDVCSHGLVDFRRRPAPADLIVNGEHQSPCALYVWQTGDPIP
jgi:hypothetical protein